jgi:hypothetical protein
MWRVTLPDIDISPHYDLCISRVRDQGEKAQLASIKNEITTANVSYQAMAPIGNLHTFPASSDVSGVPGDHLTRTYTSRMAKKDGPGRLMYDQLKALPKGDRCPFCGHRNVSTLDHILPKSEYPVLAVTPANLVGACSDCNNIKDTHTPTCPEDSFLHPYYENLDDAQWLFATLLETAPASLEFRVQPVAPWGDNKNARLSMQFKLLKLNELYSSQSASELADIRHNLQRHFDSDGADAVRDELLFQWNSRKRNRRNSWSTACYQAMAASEWFCSGGYAIIE